MKIVSFLGVNCLVLMLMLAAVFATGWFAGRARGRRQGRTEEILRKERSDD
jgi:lipopolysaccharide biosynthesis regulator YciM